MKTCVITFGHDRSWYPAGIQRLKDSFRNNGYDGDFRAYQLESDLGCPSHSSVPYAFKAYALSRVYTDGYERVIWCDSSIQLVRPYSVVAEHLDDVGYMLFRNGWTTGQWCSDAALETLGITRDQSFDIPHLQACVMGFDLPKSDRFIHEYFAKANDGVSFKGAWSNENQQVSTDSRVLGHRHDQTAASVIAYKLDMLNWLPGVHYDETPGVPVPDTAIFTLRHGM